MYFLIIHNGSIQVDSRVSTISEDLLNRCLKDLVGLRIQTHTDGQKATEMLHEWLLAAQKGILSIENETTVLIKTSSNGSYDLLFASSLGHKMSDQLIRGIIKDHGNNPSLIIETEIWGKRAITKLGELIDAFRGLRLDMFVSPKA